MSSMIIYAIISRIVHHPQANSWSNYDFTLVRIEPIDFTDEQFEHIRPVCLPSQDVPVGADVILIRFSYLV